MIFRQFVDEDLGCASYLVGDSSTGEAVVVDPAYAIEQYLAQAERDGVRITAVLETHTHADHVSGHGRFALEHGIPVRISPLAEPDYPFEPLEDGAEVATGEVVLRVIHTPGHRPEHCCFAVIDHSRGDQPWLVLTGDSLFVGDAARPDLAVEAREGARDLYRSLNRLLELPDGVEIYPGHVAGSLCGAHMSSKASTTVGFERRFNHALRVVDEAAFVDESAGVQAPKPPNAERIVGLNRGPFLGAPDPVRRLDSAGDAVVLDVRPLDAYLAAHTRGAINVPIDGTSFATKAGFMLLDDEAVVIRGATEDEAQRAARSLRGIGVLELGGFMLDGAEDEHTEPVTLDELERLLDQDAVELFDVREPDEHADGYIPGSRNVPYRIARRCADVLATTRPIVTVCETGARAAVAASALAHEGLDARPVLGGGVTEWQERHQTVAFRRCGDS